ncbi:hypothetical protein HYPSUDRAFT_491520 [Hypholoma sublateritium FD-334 SS-4]|uniref:Uncharacterized protein n=1 Tax=Hypholoma sublateritium (strain FD-334 SS-4) TaxID=945553 RepID=A0A0D2PEE0_HYPSF|nr:hypothetical protein HYPSUDRAFT_491520 [Hypholoma sublateritium FD-334 SS-4]
MESLAPLKFSEILFPDSRSRQTLAAHLKFLRERKLLPPMIGQHSADDIIQWTQKSPELCTFSYSIPTSMFTYSVNKKQHLRKLVYVEQTNPTKVLQLETAHTPESTEGDTVTDSMVLDTRCYISEKFSNNILLPHRPTDMQISVARVHDIPIPDLPYELSSFIAATSDERICRELKTIILDGKSINIVTETSTDEDIDQHQTVCKIVCEDHSSSQSWREFLNSCDKIATLN